MNEDNGEHPLGHIGQMISLVLFLVLWIGDSFFLRSSTFLADHLPLPVRIAALVLLLALAFVLGRSGHGVVKHEQRPDHVVTTGAFRYVRHPLYLASLLTYLGLAIATASLFSLALLAGIFLFHDHIASYEEKLLEARFGEEYRQYKRRTGKWVPGVGKGE